MNTPNLSEQQVREIVRQELSQTSAASRFALNPIQRHIHNGQDAPRISQANVIPNSCATGTITFAQQATYFLQFNAPFTPSRIDVHGNITGSGGEKAISVGLAILTPSFEFQPNTTTSVITNNIQFPRATPEFPNGNVPIQSSVYLSTTGGSTTFHTIVGDGHITNVEYPAGTIHARATVVGFSKSGIYVTVSDLDAGWAMNINYTIT